MATNDERLLEVTAEEKGALKENNELYNKMATNVGEYYDDMTDAVKAYEITQTKNQKAATDFAIEEINQKKAQTEKDYTKEQAGSYADYQKQIDPYGVQAEQTAASGLSNSGYADSLKTQAFVAYQNRVATARESYQRAVLNYDNAITEARLQNNSALAEIAYNSLQKQLQLAIEGFQYKNTLIIDKADQNLEIKKVYNESYQDVLQQINTENALEENQRQFNAQLDLEKKKVALQEAQVAKSSSSGGSGGSGSSSRTKKSSSNTTTINKSQVKKATTDKKKTAKSEPTVDMQSVVDLGYGPISASKLNELVSQGKVEEYTDGGKLKYRKVFKR